MWPASVLLMSVAASEDLDVLTTYHYLSYVVVIRVHVYRIPFLELMLDGLLVHGVVLESLANDATLCFVCQVHF